MSKRNRARHAPVRCSFVICKMWNWSRMVKTVESLVLRRQACAGRGRHGSLGAREASRVCVCGHGAMLSRARSRSSSWGQAGGSRAVPVLEWQRVLDYIILRQYQSHMLDCRKSYVASLLILCRIFSLFPSLPMWQPQKNLVGQCSMFMFTVVDQRVLFPPAGMWTGCLQRRGYVWRVICRCSEMERHRE